MTHNLRRGRGALIRRATWLMTSPSLRSSMGLCQQWAVARAGPVPLGQMLEL